MKFNRSIFLISILFLPFNMLLLAQQDTIWEKGTDYEKLENIFRILTSQTLSADQQIYLSLKASEIAVKQNDKKAICLSYKYLGNGYFSKSDFETAIKLYTTTLELATEINDQAIISDCYYNISFAYKNLGNFAEALKNSKIAFNLDYARNDSSAMAESYNSIGIIYENMGDYHKALGYYLKSLTILENRSDYTGIAQRYNNIGIVFYNLSNFVKAKEYLLKSIELFESLGNVAEKCKPMTSLGDLYERIEKYDSALFLFKQVFELYNQANDKYLKANILLRMGDVFSIKGEFKKAREYYRQSLDLKLDIKDYDGVVRAQTNLAKINFQLNNTNLALPNLNATQQYVKMVNSKKLLSDIYELYYLIYKKENDISKALHFNELFNSMKDSIFSENNNKKIYELQTIYETEKTEKENEILRQSNKIQALEVAKANTIKNLFLIIALFILILTYILYRRYRSKLKINSILNEKNLLLEDQKAQITKQKLEIEKKNRQITDSIEYANLIQQAMLPSTQILKNAFAESFILFMPKNIVSGDFYWFYELENKLVVAVADCTGHGVPGAFMSMIGMEMLHEVFDHYKISEPDLALNHLRENISKVLQQEDSGNLDGMDVAICVIDKENKIIEYAGAKIPLLIVENEELHEIKANKFSIGGQSSITDLFNKQIIHYRSPISIYLFSDGYHDQFGGPNNMRINSNLFKELLYINSTKTMQEQIDYLLDFHLKWKGDNTQIDDILVVGIRIE